MSDLLNTAYFFVVKIRKKMNIKQWFIKNKMLTRVWLILISVSLIFTLLQRRDAKPDKVRSSESLDTYIPEGFVLLPIEIHNASAMKGLLSTKAVVDLYTSDPLRVPGQKAAEGVKIIRLPNDETHFAALVPENKVHFLIKRSQAFYAVIQHPGKTETKIQPLLKKRKRSIVIDLEESPSF